EMTYRNTEDKEYNVVYGNVPVQRNYRTNIYGNLLTDQTGVIVEIKPAFEDDAADVDPYIRPWDGTMEQPAIDGNTVYIATGEQLAFFANAVNTNATFDNTQTRAEVEYAKANVVLTHDIDLNNLAWTPIVFNKGGKFDGQGHTIKNLYVNVESATGSAGLFDSAKYVKDVILENVNVTGHYRTGALVGNGLCARIENCHVKGGTVTSTVVGKDNANHVGGIVGYLSAENEAYVKGCSVENVTVKGYRDVGGIAGTANASGSNVAVVEKNTIKDVTVIADQTVEYVEYKAANAGAVVGRNNRGIDLSNNYTENVEVKVLANANSLAGILTSNAKNIEVTLAENVDLPISSLGQITGGSGEYKLGGVDTETITIDLNGKTLNITTTYWSNLGAKNDNALFTIKNGKMTSSQATGTWNSYDLTFSNCDYAFEDVVFEKAVAFDNAGKKVSMKNVTINETHDYYAMWITATGQTVNVEGLTINSLGRGIKIDEQYVGTPAKVTLNVKDSKIKSAKKAAIVVKSVAGAEINVEDLDITEAAADTKFAVWVDEDAAAYAEKVVVNGAYCKVEGSADAVASTETELKAALENGGTVILDSDFTIDQSLSNGYGKTGINMTNGGTLDGNGNELGAPKSTGTWDSAINTSGGTIKNIKITKGFRGIFIKIDENHNEKLYLDNVTIDGTTYTISCDSGNGLGLEAKDSTFKGWTSFAGTLGEAKFVDCYFGYGSGYSFCRPYAPTEFVGCEFEKGFRIDPRANISFENCTLDGVAITAENVATLVSDVAKVTIK
ncbi:MAG: hypothetical protein II323_00395, partial [Tidjanibacter sp.]|nr:hypothetical protein [Tidjanibacter sp.]